MQPVFGNTDPLGQEEAPFEEEPLGPLEEEPPPPPYHSVVLQSTVVTPQARGSWSSAAPPLAAPAAGARRPTALAGGCSQLHCLLAPLQEPANTSGRQAGSGTYGVSRPCRLRCGACPWHRNNRRACTQPAGRPVRYSSCGGMA